MFIIAGGDSALLIVTSLLIYFRTRTHSDKKQCINVHFGQY